MHAPDPRRLQRAPLDACLTRQPRPVTAPGEIVPVAKQETAPRVAPVRFLGWPLGVLVATALGGMGTGAGVMALLLPVTLRQTQPQPVEKTVPVAPMARSEDLIAPVDTRQVVAEVLKKGGRKDPFAPLVASLPEPEVADTVATLPPPAPSLVVARAAAPAAEPVSRALPVAIRPTGGRILPPPALVARLLPMATPTHLPPAPLPAVSPAAAVNLPTPAAEPEPTPVQSVQPAPAAPEALESTPSTPPGQTTVTVAVLPPPAADLGVLHLAGIAQAGSNRIALLRIGEEPEARPTAEGEIYGGWLVRSIGEDQVVLEQEGRSLVLKVGE